MKESLTPEQSPFGPVRMRRRELNTELNKILGIRIEVQVETLDTQTPQLTEVSKADIDTEWAEINDSTNYDL